MSKHKKLVPRRRFQEFREAGDWEGRKLLDCVQKIIDFRGRTPTKLGLEWSDNGYLALSALNVKDGYIDFTQDVHYGNQTLYDKWMSGNELHRGQVLFTTEAPMGNVAQVPDNKRYILSQRTIAFDTREELITENFLATVLRTPNILATLTALSSGGTAKGVSQKSLEAVDIVIPSDLNEQEKIAELFHYITHHINLHQRKLEKMKVLKAAYLSEMFPAEGERKPKRRFKGFTDDWEQRKLNEIVSLITKGTTPIDKSGNGTVNFIKIENIDLSLGGVRITAKISEEEHNGYLLRSQLQENDILFSIAGTLGRVIVVNKEILPANTNQALAIIRLKSGYIDYITTYLKGKTITDYIKKNPTVGAQPNLSLEQVGNLAILMPSNKEQRVIGDFFHAIDHLITLQRRTLEKLQNIKTAYLNEMFAGGE